MSYFKKCGGKPTLVIPPEVVNKRLQKQLDFLRKDSNKMREFIERVSYGHFKTIEAMKAAQKCLDELSE